MSNKYRNHYDSDLEDEFYQGNGGNHDLENELDQRDYVIDGDELLTKEQASEREYERNQEEKERKRQEKKNEAWDEDEDFDEEDENFDDGQPIEPSAKGSPVVFLILTILIISGISYFLWPLRHM